MGQAVSSLSKDACVLNPAYINGKTLGAPGAAGIFVTATKNIKGLNALGIANKLTIPKRIGGFKVIEFETPMNGLSSPINRTNPGLVGGAREYTIPNQNILANAKITTVKRWNYN